MCAGVCVICVGVCVYVCGVWYVCVCDLLHDTEICLTCQGPYPLLSVKTLVLYLFVYFVYPHVSISTDAL